MTIEVPWLPHLATEFLAARVRPGWECFEWGSGGSTRWLAARCRRVVTVEHDEAWAGGPWPGNVEFLHVPPERGEVGPDPSDPAHYKSAGTDVERDVNFRRYCHAVDAYGEFDLVLVDGKARASCIALAVGHVRPGGWLAVDNTGDRPYYLARTAALFGDWRPGSWERVTFHGHGPLLAYLWECSMWRRPEDLA